jgi:hypothetical protein
LLPLRGEAIHRTATAATEISLSEQSVNLVLAPSVEEQKYSFF